MFILIVDFDFLKLFLCFKTCWVCFCTFRYISGFVGIFSNFWVYFWDLGVLLGEFLLIVDFGHISGFWGIFQCFGLNFCVLME